MGLQADRSMRLSGLSVPLDTSSQADLGRVVFDHVTIQSKSIGGLRIGPVPQLSVEGMRVEIPVNESADCWFSALSGFLKRERLLQSAKVSEFSIRNQEGGEFLRAEQAEIKRDASAIVMNGILLPRDSKKFSTAELALTGPQAGSVLIGPNRRPLSIFPSNNIAN